jgi:selenocysteine-specific elongation factor
MRVIGTAGHVDHGKSTLVEALTGYHPDRLKEEREREMTIDLGFAWMTLPDGEEIGIIDVPGHRDFIENMLSGIGGIDAALFVIAADEGVMPQTREHLAILDLLQIQGGVVALTKIDMVNDNEWLDLIEEDIRQELIGTVLENAPIVRVSGRKRVGISELVEEIGKCLTERPQRVDYGRPRLPVDRVFTISGFGTVVTGTLSDGTLRVGDEIVVLPQFTRGRIRGLQTHKRKEDIAVTGSRTAINISGINVDQITRGDVIVHPKDYEPTGRLDARLRLLSDASSALRHNTSVKLFIGSAEVVARLRLLGKEEIKPGENGWVQLEMSHPVVANRGDRFIIRRPSPGETLGGGEVLDAHPKGRHKRFSRQTLERLDALEKGTPADIFLQALSGLGVAPLKDVIAKSNLEATAAQPVIDDLIENGLLVSLENKSGADDIPGMETLVTSRGYWSQLSEKAMREIQQYHQHYPLRRGMPREELKSRLKVPPRVFNGMMTKLTSSNAIQEVGLLVCEPGYEIRFTNQQQHMINGLLAGFNENLYTPPTVKECQTTVGEDVYQALVDGGVLIQVSPEVVFSKEGYESMLSEVIKMIQEDGAITAAQVRDRFNTSRRYVLAFLEHLDSRGITVREGDTRRLRR